MHSLRNILVISDLHISEKPEWRYKELEKFVAGFEDMLNADKCFIHNVIFLGDMFEISNRNDNRSLDLFGEMIRVLEYCDKSESYWICGQHDMFNNKPCLSFLEDKIHILYDEAEILFADKYVGIPYMRDIEKYRRCLEQYKGENKVLFTHMPTSDFIRAKVGKEYISISDFSDYKYVISGDLHRQEVRDNFYYNGCLFPRDFRDEIDKTAIQGGVLVYRMDDNSDYMDRDVYSALKEYKMLTIRNEQQINDLDMNTRYCIRLVGNELMDRVEYLKTLPNVIDVVWKAQEISHEEVAEASNVNSSNPNELIKNYVDQFNFADNNIYIKQGEKYIEIKKD